MLRFATIGTSTITRTFAAAAGEAGRSGDPDRPALPVELAVAYSRDADRAAAFAAEIGARSSSADLDAVLADPGVDAVYVASPNGAHADQARRALLAGKHVLCEKPMVPTAAEAAELLDLARERGLVLLEAMRSAFDPGMAIVRELLPQVGPVRRVTFAYCQRSARYDKVLAGEHVNIFDPALGGGALLDLGVYCISPLVDLFGEPQTVATFPVPIITGADGAGVVVAGYDGMVADLSYSKISASDVPSQIQGERATLTIDHVAAPRRVTLTPSVADGPAAQERVLDLPPDNLVYEIEAFAQFVDSGTWPQREAARTLAAARLMDRARA